MQINNSAAAMIVMENIRMMSLDQESARDTMHYKGIAMEATQTPQGTATLLQKLYRSIIGRRGINFGKIPESKGDLTKYFKYEYMCDCMDALSEAMIQINPQPTEYILLKKLHNFIISSRGDFEWGFKTDNEYLKLTYNTMVMSMHEMINVCIVIYTDFIKQPASTNYRYTGFDKQKLIVVKNLEDMIQMWESGEWAKLMIELRKGARNIGGSSIPGLDIASNSWVSWLFGALGNIGIPAAVVKVLSSAATPVLTTLAGPAAVVAGILATLFAIRALVALFYTSAYSLKSKIDHNEEFVKIHMEANKAAGNTTAYNRQAWLYEHMVGLSDRIENNLFKENAKASMELKKENKTEFSASALRNASTNGDSPVEPIEDDTFTLG